jgi:uncharacterized protein (TIGR03067 family)
MRVRIVLFFPVVLLLGFAPAPFPRSDRDRSPRTDLSRMQGTWEVIERRHENQLLEDEQLRVIIEGKRWSFRFRGRLGSRWDIEVNPDTAPRSLNLYEVERRRYLLRGVYQFDGDTLTICHGSDGVAARPARFEGDDRNWLLIMRRARR